VLSAVNVDLGREVTEEVQAYLPLAEQMGKAIVGLAGRMAGRVTLRAEGKIATHELRPLKLAFLKGALSGFSTEPVSYVNAATIAEQRGLVVDLESSEESDEYVSSLRVSLESDPTSLAGTLAKRGPTMVEIMGNEVELPFSDHVLIVRNSDVPGVIGRVGTYLGTEAVNIANMVVGRSTVTGEASMMGLNLDQELSEDQLAGLRALDGIEEAKYLDLT